MSRFVLSLLLVFSLAIAQEAQDAPTPYDQPLNQPITDPATVLATIQQAQSHIFVIVPTFQSETLINALAQARARGVIIYAVTNKDALNPLALALVNAGAELRTLNQLAEGIVLIDYKTLITGGLISGTDNDTMLVDTQPFGDTLQKQLGAMWQSAEPYGG